MLSLPFESPVQCKALSFVSTSHLKDATYAYKVRLLSSASQFSGPLLPFFSKLLFLEQYPGRQSCRMGTLACNSIPGLDCPSSKGNQAPHFGEKAQSMTHRLFLAKSKRQISAKWHMS